MQRLKASHRNLVAILLLLCFTAILTVIPSLDNPVIAANSDGFDYPISNVDRPTRTWGDSDGWYVSNDFGNYLSGSPCSAHYHPGDDWNKDNGVDAGETVRAVSNGKVESIRTLTNSLGTALGQGIGISHVLPDGSTVYSVYVHVNVNSSMFVGKTVTRGDPIATIYNLSSGPHLHFEMRTSFNPGDWYPGDDGCGYYYSYDAVISHGFIDPVAFLDSHRSLASCNNGSSESYRINGGPPLHPHGTLIKVNGNSTVYLIWNGQKRGITSESVLSNLYQQSNSNFKGSVITVAADELSSYPDGQVISSALPSNGRGQPDGRLIKNSAGEISIVTDNGRRRPFSSGTVFTQLGYSFCNAVLASDYDSYPVGSIVEGREALPTITSSITLSPSSPYNVGQSITAAFSITNRGNTSITFSRLLAGGRLNGSTITDFPTHSNITLTPNQSYYYQSSRSFANAGSYQFFPAFQTQDSIWRLSLNNEIGVAPGVVSVISATVDAGTKPTTTTNFASNVASTTAQLNGTVNPNGSATYIWFEWGTGSTLSSFNSTPQQSVGSGNTSLNVSATLTGLASGANYFYRLAASNSSGTSRGSILSFTTTAPNNIQVTIQTSPAGRSFTVDGTAYASAQTFTWTSGSSHSIGTTSPQNGATGTRYVWGNWNDGGAISHTIAPSSSRIYTANFVTQYFLTMPSGSGGTVSPPNGWYNRGQTTSISAAPNSGYNFNGWSGNGVGSYTGSSNPASLTMSGPITEAASFTTSNTVVNVVWTNAVGVSVSGNTLTKTATSIWGNAGASSTKAIASGNGYMEFTATATNAARIAGLSHGDTNQGWQDIDFGIDPANDGRFYVCEFGIIRGSFGTYAAGDRFRVSVENGIVRYYRNGALFYTSNVAPTYPLLVDAALYNTNVSVSNAVIAGSSLQNTLLTAENIIWTQVIGASISGNSLTKTAASGWGNAGAISTRAISSGDGYMEFTATNTTAARIAGLSHGDTDQSWQDIDFGIDPANDGRFYVCEAGTIIGSFGTYAAGDRFRVAIEGGVVKYYRNRVLFYTSRVAPSYPLLVDAALYSTNASVSNAVIYGSLQYTGPSRP